MKIDRLISIIMVLLQQPRISASVLADKMGVTVRTIYRDVDTLSLAGIPIVTYPGAGGGIGILEDYKVDKRLFTKEDITVLVDSLSSMPAPLSGHAQRNAVAKLQSILPDTDFYAGKFMIDPTPWGEPAETPADLILIQRALVKNNPLQFDYIRFNGTESTRIVEPGRLILKGFHWYLQAFCRMRKDFRIFKLMRIQNIELLDETFMPKKLPPVSIDDENWVSSQTNTETITLLIKPTLKAILMETCGEEAITTAPNGNYFVEMPFVDNEWGYNYLLSLGENCECLSPAHIRQKLSEKIERLHKIYIQNITS